MIVISASGNLPIYLATNRILLDIRVRIANLVYTETRVAGAIIKSDPSEKTEKICSKNTGYKITDALLSEDQNKEIQIRKNIVPKK